MGMKKRFSIGMNKPIYDDLLKTKKELGMSSLGELFRKIVDDWYERKTK